MSGTFRKTAFTFTAVMMAAILPDVAKAESSVTVNGQTYTCTNSCVVTISPDGTSYSITDCCGGQISTTFYPIGSGKKKQ